jgi:hypothetical protein
MPLAICAYEVARGSPTAACYETKLSFIRQTRQLSRSDRAVTRALRMTSGVYLPKNGSRRCWHRRILQSRLQSVRLIRLEL